LLGQLVHVLGTLSLLKRIPTGIHAHQMLQLHGSCQPFMERQQPQLLMSNLM
jgi:hypothetical protein